MYEVVVKKAADLNTSGDISGAKWAPGFLRHKIHAVALIIDNTIAATGVVKFDKRVTFGSDTGRGDGDVAVINLATSHTGGKVVYKDGLDVDVSPGEEVVVEVTDVTGASDVADVVLVVEAVYEQPANIAAMVETT